MILIVSILNRRPYLAVGFFFHSKYFSRIHLPHGLNPSATASASVMKKTLFSGFMRLPDEHESVP